MSFLLAAAPFFACGDDEDDNDNNETSSLTPTRWNTTTRGRRHVVDDDDDTWWTTTTTTGPGENVIAAGDRLLSDNPWRLDDRSVAGTRTGASFARRSPARRTATATFCWRCGRLPLDEVGIKLSRDTY
jgi:hypothetical protein